MQGVSVVPEEVAEIGRYVYNIAETMRQALESAGKDVDSMLSDGWTGDAADEFSEGWTETRDGGAKLMQTLTTLAEKLGVTAANYQTAEADAAASVARLNM